MFDRLEKFFIANRHKQDAYIYSRYKLVLRASLLTSSFSFFYLLLSFVVEYSYGTYLMIFNVTGFLLLPFLMMTSLPIKLLGNLYVFIGASAVVIAIYFSGGVESPVLGWLIVSPVLALLVVNKMYAWYWTGLSLACLFFFVYQAMAGRELPVLYNVDWNLTFVLLSNAGVILIVMVIGLIFATTTSRALHEVDLQKKELSSQNELIRESNKMLTTQQEELLATSDKLTELNNKKDFLLEILAHDLKTPLANIQGLIGIIKTEGYKPSSLEERVHSLIVESSRKSQKLIEKILSSENLAEVVYDLKLERVDVSDVLSQVISNSSGEAARKGIDIHFDNPLDSEYPALADPMFLSQVYENLLTNAIKFSPQGANVYVTVNAEGDSITAGFRDEGPGILEEEMEHLFKRYRKLSNKPTGDESSTGLGLSIVKHYTDLLNGRVWCESKPGSGSHFRVSLPRA